MSSITIPRTNESKTTSSEALQALQANARTLESNRETASFAEKVISEAGARGSVMALLGGQNEEVKTEEEKKETA